MSNTNSGTETYAGKVDRIAAELLDVLRDVLGPERRLPETLAVYARHDGHAVTVIDGAGVERVELTAHLTMAGTIQGYSARITHGDPIGRRWAAAGPVRVDCSEDPEERPTLTYVLPLIVRLEEGAKRMKAAQKALKDAGLLAMECGPKVFIRDPFGVGTPICAAIELDPVNGALRVHGRDAGEVCKVLRKVNVF